MLLVVLQPVCGVSLRAAVAVAAVVAKPVQTSCCCDSPSLLHKQERFSPLLLLLLRSTLVDVETTKCDSREQLLSVFDCLSLLSSTGHNSSECCFLCLTGGEEVHALVGQGQQEAEKTDMMFRHSCAAVDQFCYLFRCELRESSCWRGM